MKRSSPTKRREQRRVRLLIHAVDGCVPYLTPDSLEKYFPPSDDFWIGLAVRDTCVLPTFSSDGTDKPKKVKLHKTSKNHTSNPTLMTERDPKKPRGYTFAPVAPDSWLLPYTRVTVPSFDWMEDNSRKKKESSQQPSSGSTSTNQSILVWTPHGRQKLTSALYATASAGLQSKFTLSLYDMAEEPNNTKRLEKADTRNEEWFRDLLQRRKADASCTDTLWSPILLPTATSSDTLLNMYHESVDDIGGVALIGKWWPGLESILQAKLLDVPQVAMLTTYSFKEILEIASSNVVDTIGTDLPTKWSKDKLAFAVDLTVNPIGHSAKRSKQDHDAMVSSPYSLNQDGCMDLTDTAFARDPQPLVPGCNCLACANDKFSRAYVHHLICAQELLADMLLFGHNLHHLLQFIRVFNSMDNPVPWVEGIVTQLSRES